MPKAYWIACYREITQPDKLAAYAKLALPAIEAGGGKFLARAADGEHFRVSGGIVRCGDLIGGLADNCSISYHDRSEGSASS